MESRSFPLVLVGMIAIVAVVAVLFIGKTASMTTSSPGVPEFPKGSVTGMAYGDQCSDDCAYYADTYPDYYPWPTLCSEYSTYCGACTQCGSQTNNIHAFGSNAGANTDTSANATCTDPCDQYGQASCNGNITRFCTYNSAGNCLNWQSNTTCTNGCSNGYCLPETACANECSGYGQQQCVGTYAQTCGNYDNDSCLEWGNTTYCQDGCSESTGFCQDTSTAQCQSWCSTYAEKYDMGWPTMCNSYKDSCSSCAACGSQTANPHIPGASAETASPTCTNPCDQYGQMSCSGNDLTICGYNSAGNCLNWQTNRTCANGCSNNACNAAVNTSCTNECSPGALECNGNIQQTCGNYDADPCTEWGNENYCQNGCDTNGQCSFEDAKQCQSWCAKYEQMYSKEFPEYYSWDALCTGQYSTFCNGCGQC